MAWCLGVLVVGSPVSFQEFLLDHKLRNSPTPEKHQIETMLGGVALLDYDGDGLLDIYFTNGAKQPELVKEDRSWWNRLYRNRGAFQFEDVTEKAGVRGEGFSSGVAAADFDNDGHPDLLVAGVRRNILYRNRGDGTFEDVTAKAGIRAAPWSVAAGWFDYDNDGWLDLFVVNYTDWNPATEPVCEDLRGNRYHCDPRVYTGYPNTLYRNLGNGSFRDVSQESGIAGHIGKGMSVAFADYNADGRLDAFVSNDTLPNFLFRNDGGGRFTEVALTAGVAVNDDGRALSSMGVDFRDVDNDGRPDLFITALANETFPYFRHQGAGLYADRTYTSLVGAATMALTGWSNGIYDFDNDGRKDFFAANGDLNDNAEALFSRPTRQRSLVLLQRANGKFAAQPAGPAARYRGAAFGDLDNDGRVDVVLARIGERAVILRNLTVGGHWLGLRLTGTKSNRDAIGALMRVRARSGEQWNHVTTSVGYASSSDPRVHFGLGPDTTADVQIRWPSGTVQNLGEVKADRYHAVREPRY